MSRYLLKRRKDGLYLRRGRTPSGWNSGWTEDINNARVFTQTGHVLNSAIPDVSRRPFETPHIHTEWCVGRTCYQHMDFDGKAHLAAKREAFNRLYEIVKISFNVEQS